MSLRFEKMEGLGNDFIVIDLRRSAPAIIKKIRARASEWCDRRRGVGADQILVIFAGRKNSQMRVFNTDGSEAEIGSITPDASGSWKIAEVPIFQDWVVILENKA